MSKGALMENQPTNNQEKQPNEPKKDGSDSWWFLMVAVAIGGILAVFVAK